MISDSIVRLIEAGVINGRRKEIDRGYTVTGTAFGGPALYERLASAPILFRPASYTHSGHTLAQLRSLVAVNSALQIDLAGQVGAEVVAHRYIGAIGGQVDF